MSIVLLLLASGGGLPPFADLLRHRWPGSPRPLPWENRPAQDRPHPQNVEIKAARTERESLMGVGLPGDWCPECGNPIKPHR